MENCNTCYKHLRYGCGGQGDFREDIKKNCFKPDYQTLESQLSAANQQIAGYRVALKDCCYQLEMIKKDRTISGLVLSGWIRIINKALSHPAFADEENEPCTCDDCCKMRANQSHSRIEEGKKK